MAKTIGIDCRLYSPKHTGIGRYVAELVNHLGTLDQENRYILYFNAPEFEGFQIPNERWQKKLVNIPHYSVDEQTRWLFFLNHEPLDLMHFPHFNVPIFYRKPFVVTIHDLTLHHFPYKNYTAKWNLRKWLEIAAYRWIMGQVTEHAKRIIAVSDYTKHDLEKEYRLDPEKITRVYEGVPEHFQRPSEEGTTRTREKYSIQKPYLIYAGVWRSHKNLIRLLEAMRKVVDRGSDVQLVLCGKKDPAYPEIPEAIARLNLQDRVVLTDFVADEELVVLMSGASLFVFPSLSEGFGLPPLEAMKLGVPVVCSDRTSLPEVCGDAAVTFNPEDSEDMMKKILLVLKSPEEQQKRRELGYKNLERFSWKAMAGEILDLYQR